MLPQDRNNIPFMLQNSKYAAKQVILEEQDNTSSNAGDSHILIDTLNDCSVSYRDSKSNINTSNFLSQKSFNKSGV